MVSPQEARADLSLLDDVFNSAAQSAKYYQIKYGGFFNTELSPSRNIGQDKLHRTTSLRPEQLSVENKQGTSQAFKKTDSISALRTAHYH